MSTSSKTSCGCFMGGVIESTSAAILETVPARSLPGCSTRVLEFACHRPRKRSARDCVALSRNSGVFLEGEQSSYESLRPMPAAGVRQLSWASLPTATSP